MIFDSDTAHEFTQWLMAAGFVSAALCCAKSRRPFFAIFFVLATVETFVRARYPFHVQVRDALIAGGSGSADKEQLQIALLALMALLALAAGGWMVRAFLRHSWCEGLVQLGFWSVLGVLGLELISLHAVDRFIYAIDGPFIRSGWAYFLSAAAVVTGLFATSLAKRPGPG